MAKENGITGKTVSFQYETEEFAYSIETISMTFMAGGQHDIIIISSGILIIG